MKGRLMVGVFQLNKVCVCGGGGKMRMFILNFLHILAVANVEGR